MVSISGNSLFFAHHSLSRLLFQRFSITCSIVLKKEEPRAGKRKPIEESEDEDDTKKNDTTQNNADLTSASQPSGQEAQGAQAASGTQAQEKEKVVRANNT